MDGAEKWGSETFQLILAEEILGSPEFGDTFDGFKRNMYSKWEVTGTRLVKKGIEFRLEVFPRHICPSKEEKGA